MNGVATEAVSQLWFARRQDIIYSFAESPALHASKNSNHRIDISDLQAYSPHILAEVTNVSACLIHRYYER